MSSTRQHRRGDWTRGVLLLCLLTLLASAARAQGIPFIRNYTSTEYKGHNQNFDIICDEDGTVYAANFEGLLYYNQAEWHIIHTPGITRITCVFRDSKGRIWTGGYNYFGYVTTTDNGRRTLKTLDNNQRLHGEVQWIWERDGRVSFLVSGGKVYDVKGDGVAHNANGQPPTTGTSTLGRSQEVRQVQQMDHGLQAVVTNGNGLLIQNAEGHKLLHLTEENGLCSDNVTHVSYNGRGMLWGATENGIFAIAVPSIYSHFTQSEGLHGEVLSLALLNKTLYAGTQNGLFRLEGKQFVTVGNITHACWNLANADNHLLAATANGVYSVSNQQVRQLTTNGTTAVMADSHGFYCGETDGLYHYTPDGKGQLVCQAERVVKILKDYDGSLWLQNLYGRIWKGNGKQFAPVGSQKANELATIVNYDGRISVIPVHAKEPFPYPQCSYTDLDGISWLTDNKGRGLYAFFKGMRHQMFSELVYPLMDFSARAVLRDMRTLWIGGDKGLVVVDCSGKELSDQHPPKLYIRSVRLHNDSILWGGYGPMPTTLPTLSADQRHIVISFSVDYPLQLLATQYRYRINGGKWSAWDNDTYEEFNNQQFGDYLFEVQARDAYGRLTDTAAVHFTIAPPLYLRWYMLLLYVVLAALLLTAGFRWRLRMLEREKEQLENIVKERTAEVVKLEKVAAVGKLTQGLIDRILNPMNYINNFAKLSQQLVGDVKANVEDEKENMSEDNYEDTLDVLDMLKGNLEKVEEHGASTTRTLKAMEEMLKDRSGGIAAMDIITLLKQNEEMVCKYYEKEIADYAITVSFHYCADSVMLNGNAEQLSKTFMSMLGNAVYAVRKQYLRDSSQHPTGYRPEVTLNTRQEGGKMVITIRDNGIGIEHTIIDKIFDPFFTTKTTGEASGVGLYLSKEIVQNYGGDITVKSEKNVYTEFTITLPTL